MARKKVNKEEIKEEVVEEVKASRAEETKEEVTPNAEKPKKRINVWSELKSFFIILVIIGLFILGGWAWYSSMKDNKNDDKDKSTEKIKYAYKIVDSNSDEYTKDGSEYNKIIDVDGTEINLDESLYVNIYEGVDGKDYLVDRSDEDEGRVTVGSLKDNKIEDKYTIDAREGYWTVELLYTNAKEEEYLSGFVQIAIGYEDEESSDKNYFVTLDNKVVELNGYSIASNYAVLDLQDNLYTYNERYVPFTNKDETKYGLLDYVTGKIVIEAKYDFIFPTYNNTFIAEKNGKTGIIDAKEKVLVVFEYDFIDNNDGFYAVSKNDKLAIMNKNHEFITGFEFEGVSGYTYKPCCANNNDFYVTKFGDKYLLSIENEERTINNENYSFDNYYVIYPTGKFETIEKSFVDFVNDGMIIFNEKSRTYSFYDEDLEEKYSIDVSSFAFAKEPQYFYTFGDIIGICGKDVFFNKDTGKEVELDKIVFEDNNFKFEFDKKNVRLFIDGKEIYQFESDLNEYYVSLDKVEDGYTISDINNEKTVLIYKK